MDLAETQFSGTEGLFHRGPITTEAQKKLHFALNRPLEGLNGRQILSGNIALLGDLNSYLQRTDESQNGGKNKEFYERNTALIEEFSRKNHEATEGKADVWDEDRFREFLVGFELDTQLQAVALDNPRDALRAQVDFLLSELDNPTSLEIQRAQKEAKRLHYARMLSVYPDRIGSLENVQDNEKEFINKETRSCYGDRMTQGRDKARGNVEYHDALKAYLEDLAGFKNLCTAVDEMIIDPAGTTLKQGFDALRLDPDKPDSLLCTLIDASYTPTDGILSKDEIIKAKTWLRNMILSDAAKAAQLIHGGILAGSSLNIVSDKLERDQHHRIKSDVAKFIAARKAKIKEILTDPLYSPEAAGTFYQDIEKLPLERDLHILQRLAELSPQKEKILEEAMEVIGREIKLREEFSDDLSEGSDIFTERILMPVAKRGKRYADAERRLDRVFSEEKTKANRDARYRLRRDLREMGSFLKTVEGRQFLKQLDDVDFVCNVAEMAKKGDKRLKARVVEDNGNKEKVYDYPEGRFLAQAGRWLPVMIEYRELRGRLYDAFIGKDQVIPHDNRNLPEFDKFRFGLTPDFGSKLLPHLEDMLTAGPSRRIEKAAAKIKGKLDKESQRVKEVPAIDKSRIKIIARETIRKGEELLGRRRRETVIAGESAATGSDIGELERVMNAPEWDTALHGEQRGEIPIHEIRNELPEAVTALPEGQLIEGLETVEDTFDLNEGRMETSLQVFRSNIEEGLLPWLEEQGRNNPNIAYLTRGSEDNQVREILFRDTANNRQIRVEYTTANGQRRLLHADFRTYPLGRDENIAVGQREFQLSLDIRDGTYRIISDYNTDPRANYSRIDTTINRREKGMTARCVELRGVDLVNGIHRSGKREWNYLRENVLIGDEEIIHGENHFLPPGSGEGAVDLPSIFTRYADYVISILPIREVSVEPVSDVERFDSPPWKEAISLLEQISWKNEDENHNYVVKKAAFDMFQGINQGNFPIVQESARRVERGERPTRNVEEYTEHIERLIDVIDNFEEIAQEVDPVRLRQMLESGLEINGAHPQSEATRSLIERLNRAHLFINDYAAQLPANTLDKEAVFVDYWLYLTDRFDGINEFLKRRSQEPDMLLYMENQRLAQHPLIGVLEQRVFKSGEAIRQAREYLDSIAPEQRFMVNEKWLGVLEMMDSMDTKERYAKYGYPHIGKVNWYSYHHPNQGLGLPFPNEDGSISTYQRQMIESVNWVRRLAKEIDPQEILNFPRLDESLTYGIQDAFIEKHDPSWTSTLHDVSLLLEKLPADNHYALDFTLTEENYKRLDTPQKKLAAFLLLRERLSKVVSGTIGSFEFQLKDIDDYSDTRKLFKAAIEQKTLRPIDQALLSSSIGGEKFTDWFRRIYEDPLFTNTGEVFMHGRNHNREKFIKKARAILAAKIPGKE